MIKIQLSNAENGIIKTVSDTQYNGADKSIEITRVYELDEDSEIYFDIVAGILMDISRDLGLELGGNYDRDQLNFQIDWGISYSPTLEEVNEKIKDLKREIRELNEYKKEISKE